MPLAESEDYLRQIINIEFDEIDFIEDLFLSIFQHLLLKDDIHPKQTLTLKLMKNIFMTDVI